MDGKEACRKTDQSKDRSKHCQSLKPKVFPKTVSEIIGIDALLPNCCQKEFLYALLRQPTVVLKPDRLNHALSYPAEPDIIELADIDMPLDKVRDRR